MAKTSIRYEDIPLRDKVLIYEMTISDKYFITEILHRFHITRLTHWKIMNEIKNHI